MAWNKQLMKEKKYKEDKIAGWACGSHYNITC